MQATMRRMSCQQARGAALLCKWQPGLAAAAIRVHKARATTAAAAASSSAAAAASTSQPSWQVRMLYDGECPLCMKEVNFLKSRDAEKGRIDFVDIANPKYTAEDNYGITYEQAMERIHAILADGRIVTDVEVFRYLYEAVGLGWVYAATKYEPVLKAANAVYGVWAKYRTQITGREAMAVILQRRNAMAAGGGTAGSLCTDAEGNPSGAECALPASAAASKQQQ